MPVPPLHHGILHARPDRITLGVGEGEGNREVVDDVENGHDEDEGHVIPVCHIDVRFLAPGKRAHIEHEIGYPDDDEPDIGVPFGLGIFLRLCDAEEIAGNRDETEEVEA